MGELAGSQCADRPKVAHHCNFIVLFAIFSQQFFDLPGPLPELLWRLVHCLRFDELQTFQLLFLISHLLVGAEVFLACSLDVGLEIVDEPQFRAILHVAEIIVRKLLEFFVVVAIDVAGVPKSFCEDGMHFYSNIPSPEDLPAGFQGPLIGRHQNHINLLILQLLPRPLTLLLPFLSNAAIDKLPSIRYFLVEILQLNALIPSQITVIVGLILQKPTIEVGLRMPDQDKILAILLHGYC